VRDAGRGEGGMVLIVVCRLSSRSGFKYDRPILAFSFVARPVGETGDGVTGFVSGWMLEFRSARLTFDVRCR
jgi:hypothetical protein